MLKPIQCRMARAALGWGVRDLAEKSGVSANTINRFETGKSGGYADTIEALHKALIDGGVLFIEENGEGPGVRLRKS